ncbi:glycoside hydrolase family 88/105 protein [Desertivirga brevis]|uniref:glycoside hydrolase family 88/105 protein n=1 Tax=Desertivirga brevis TaxID=2810310 RepID=UPI001A964413|nr:glycoside hydrolase family 88 protein [Pedobacter sp. SYSU D00873]
MLRKILSLVLPVFLSSATFGQRNATIFTDWKKGYDPAEVGQKLTKRFLESPHTNYGRPDPPRFITYPEVCTWFGALKLSETSRRSDLQKLLEERYLKLVEEEKSLLPIPNHVDFTVFGTLPLQLYSMGGNESYLKLGKYYADSQWERPVNRDLTTEEQNYLDKGFSWQTRLWIDDMYMINAVQVQAYKATGDEKYINRAAKEMVLYLDSLQKPNGLFFHAPDVPFYWARGNGWMAAGMTEILKSIPESNPHRQYILKGYKKMMASLLKYQTESGMWRQLIDDKGSWTETSGSAMFAYAMVTGIKKGWLKKSIYAPAARKAWLALVDSINENGDVTEVCEGTNKKNDRQFYLDRRRLIGDMHGQAPVLWTTAALLD